MAEDKDTGLKRPSVQIKLDYTSAATSVPVEYANLGVVQVYSDEVNVAFFSFTAPVITGTAEEQVAQLKGKTVQPECVARIKLSLQGAKLLLQELERHIKDYESTKCSKT